MKQTLIAQVNLSNRCDVFVLSEGGHRYRDALALALVLRHLGPDRDVQVYPVLSPREGEGDRQRASLAAEEASLLTNPPKVDRSAVVIGRAELFGPDIDLNLVKGLRPELPLHMDDTPSDEPEYRELRLISGRVKEYRISPRLERSLPPSFDYASIYSGWQAVRGSWRRIVILEGISALGTIGAVKAFCSESCFPDCLVGVEGFFLIYDVSLNLRARGRGQMERSLIRQDKRKAASALPWRWDDIVVGKIRYRQAVAALHKSGGQFSFLGSPLRRCHQRERERLRLTVLERLVSRPEDWIDANDVLRNVPCQSVRGGPRQALKQLLDGLVAQGLVIERDNERFRHIAGQSTA